MNQTIRDWIGSSATHPVPSLTPERPVVPQPPLPPLRRPAGDGAPELLASLPAYRRDEAPGAGRGSGSPWLGNELGTACR
ncbi:hypothetical protein ZWY2020_013091 [Hordeum vulgare]|nr:hypothetical protein ZWY2020_013091 [Hordeum vulgare]